jgi:hypothetical protein
LADLQFDNISELHRALIAVAVVMIFQDCRLFLPQSAIGVLGHLL